MHLVTRHHLDPRPAFELATHDVADQVEPQVMRVGLPELDVDLGLEAVELGEQTVELGIGAPHRARRTSPRSSPVIPRLAVLEGQEGHEVGVVNDVGLGAALDQVAFGRVRRDDVTYRVRNAALQRDGDAGDGAFFTVRRFRGESACWAR